MILLLCSGCVRPAHTPRRAVDTRDAPTTDQRAAVPAPHGHSHVGIPSSTTERPNTHPSTPRNRFATRRIGASPKLGQLASPPRVGPRDIRFSRTRIDNAMRLLADAGGFHLIIDQPLPQLVTAELLAVEPYDAILSIAEAHGIHVRYAGGAVQVRKGPPNR